MAWSGPNIHILGSDIAGEIEAVGKTVKSFKPGDEVYGDLSGNWGGFAEYVVARESALALKPNGMSFEEAAAIPQAGLLALQGLRDRGNLQPGQKLLINGAGGGAGTFAIQIAKLYKAGITGVDRDQKLDMMRTMGCDHTIDYKRIDFTQSRQRYDLILDVRTDRPIYRYTRVLRTNGIYVTVGGSMNRLFQALILGPWISRTRKKHIRILALRPNKGLNDMNAFFEAGQVRPVIDKCFSLNETAKAFRYYGNGHFKGKIVIRITD